MEKKIFPWRKAIALPVISDEVIIWKPNEFEGILTEAIQTCISVCMEKNGGKICTTLSGGLDSSFCLAKVREIVGPDVEIHTFTVGGNENYPDIQFARIISGLFKTIHHELIPSLDLISLANMNLAEICDVKQKGDVAVYLIYREIARNEFKCVIAHDGIDELLGGYWDHRKFEDLPRKEAAFRYFWSRLKDDHLLLLEKKADYFYIDVIFPYLQKEVVEYISKIPVDERTSLDVSKMPLRSIARKYLPISVIERQKKGFCSALEE